jgi:signal transduction histidine kinase
MRVLKVLLIDTTKNTKKLLDEKRVSNESVRLMIRMAGTDFKVDEEENLHAETDVILFGEKVPSTSILELTKAFRAAGVDVPIFIMSRQSEARVPQKYLKAGVDDVINTVEIQTPLFLWTFQSTLTQVGDRRKAQDFDVIRDRMRRANRTLAHVTHEINNPLSVIRLAIYHLENAKLPKTKKKAFFKLLVENIDKVNLQMKELYTIRRELSMDLRGAKRRSALLM